MGTMIYVYIHRVESNERFIEGKEKNQCLGPTFQHFNPQLFNFFKPSIKPQSQIIHATNLRQTIPLREVIIQHIGSTQFDGRLGFGNAVLHVGVKRRPRWQQDIALGGTLLHPHVVGPAVRNSKTDAIGHFRIGESDVEAVFGRNEEVAAQRRNFQIAHSTLDHVGTKGVFAQVTGVVTQGNFAHLVGVVQCQVVAFSKCPFEPAAEARDKNLVEVIEIYLDGAAGGRCRQVCHIAIDGLYEVLSGNEIIVGAVEVEQVHE
jgi:hypothetical protein